MARMSTYSVTEAKHKLSELIKRAVNGEGVVITRHGQPTVALTPVRPPPVPKRNWTPDEHIAWLRARRARLTPAKTDGVALVRQMRDEDWR
jgi:prevent-host-death family protein